MQIAELCKRVMMKQTDEALVEEMAQGSEQAFVEIYKRRQPAIYHYALQMSGSQSVAEDLSQEVFMIFIQQVRNFDSGQGTVGAYLYGIARKCFLRFREKLKLEIVSLDQSPIENQPHPEPLSTGNPFNEFAKGEE
jgi:RNA polymerase sigma factor (sigma-70 family)